MEKFTSTANVHTSEVKVGSISPGEVGISLETRRGRWGCRASLGRALTTDGGSGSHRVGPRSSSANVDVGQVCVGVLCNEGIGGAPSIALSR